MNRKFASRVFPFILAFSLLMLLVGSAWHVHNHHHSEADACVWCLAALVVVVLAALVLPVGIFPSSGDLVLSNSDESPSSLPWLPKASRAPPAL